MNPQNQYIKISLVLGWIYTALWVGLTLFGVFRMAVGLEPWEFPIILLLAFFIGIFVTLLTGIRRQEKWAVWGMLTITFFFLWLEYEGLRSVFGGRKIKWNTGLFGMFFVYALNALQIFFLFRVLMTWDAVGGKGFEVILKAQNMETNSQTAKEENRNDNRK